MTAFIICCFLFGAGLGLFGIWYKLPNNVGKRGEKKVAKILAKCEGTVLNDYMIIDDKGKSHQIDHILVNKKGVFVIETKNYKGRIYGDDNSERWTQVLNYGKIKNKFYSPVKQNLTHCRNLMKVLPNGTKVITIIVFVKNNTSYVKSLCTINLRQLYSTVNNEPDLYTDEEVQTFVNILNDKKATDVTDEQHVAEIKENQYKVEHNICPRYGGNLVLRHGKNGDFYGCENFPKCRYIKK